MAMMATVDAPRRPPGPEQALWAVA
jgi:hypothetical protein